MYLFVLFLLLLWDNGHCWWKSWSVIISSVIDHSHTLDKNIPFYICQRFFFLSQPACLILGYNSISNCSSLLNESPYDKTNKIACAPSEYSDQPAWASTQSDQSLRCPHKESLGPRLIWVLAGRTVILLVLSWGGSYIKLPSSGDFWSQWPPESRRVPRGCNCWGVCSYIDAQKLLLRHMFLGCNCIYKHFVEIEKHCVQI